jgi:hypothetical protein
MDEKVEVRITGDASSAASAFKVSEEAAARALSLMVEHFRNLGIVSTEEMTKTGAATEKAAVKTAESAHIAEGAMARWQHAVKEHTEQINMQFERVSAVMGKLSGAMLAIGAALAGGEAFEKAVEATITLTSENLKLSKTMGITLESASGLHAAMAKFGIQTETVTSAVQKMDRQVRTHESALNDMGVKTREVNGDYRNQLDILMDGLDALRSYKEGTDRNLASQAMFGRGAGDVTALLKLNRKELDEGAESARKLGLVTDQEAVTGMKTYKIAIAETKEVFEALMVAIGNKVLPTLTEMGEWFRDHGPAAIAAFKRGLDALGDVLNLVGTIIKQLWEIASSVFERIGDIVRATFGTITTNGEIVTGVLNFMGRSITTVGDAFKIAFEIIGFSIEACLRWVRAFAAAMWDIIHLNFSGAASEIAAFFNDTATNAEKSAGRIVDAFKEAKAAVLNMPKPMNWGDGGGSKLDALLDAEAASQKTGKKNYAAPGKATKEKKAAGTSDVDDPFADTQKQFQKNIGIMDRDSKAFMTKFANGIKQGPILPAMSKTSDLVVSKWVGGIAKISSTWANSLARMATLQQSFGATIGQLWQSVAGMITGALADVIQKYIAKWLTAMAIKHGLLAADGVSTVTSEAGKAGAGGIASMAAAPFPLNLGAPAFGASMMAAALSFMPAASAAGGFDIPAGVNPLTQLHAREMVLPAPVADTVRDAMGGKGGGGQTIAVHIHATDAQSVKRLFHDNKPALAAAIKAAIRDGVR